MSIIAEALALAMGDVIMIQMLMILLMLMIVRWLMVIVAQLQC